MSEVGVLVDGMRYSGWSRVRVERSIERISAAFEVVSSDRWAQDKSAPRVRPGDRCVVMLGDEPLMDGHVDEVSIGYDATRHEVALQGRDATGDLVDCAAETKQWSGLTLGRLAEEICAPFGVRVTDEVGDTAPFRRLKTEPGETAFELLERAARLRGALLVSDARGGLVITRAGARRAPTALVLGKNVLEASARFSHAGRFSTYTVLGQQPGDDFVSAESAAHVSATAADERITRHRPTVLIAEDPVDAAAARARAEWHRNIAFGRSLALRITVAGWQHADGIWQTNELVRVDDDFLGVRNAWWLIVATAFVRDEQGTRCTLTLMPRETFDRQPLPKEEPDARAA